MGDSKFVYVHRGHSIHDYWIEDSGRRVSYVLLPAKAYELPEELARSIAKAHPSKLCLLESGQDSDKHKCKLTREVEKEVQAALEAANALPLIEQEPYQRISHQRRKLKSQARKRSRRYRMGVPA